MWPRVKIAFLVCVFSVCVFSGCNEDQLNQADLIAADANSISTTVQRVVSSPIGAIIPPNISAILLGTTTAISSAFGAYQTWRKKQIKKIATATIKGVESMSGRKTNASVGEIVKPAIAAEMTKAGVGMEGLVLVKQITE